VTHHIDWKLVFGLLLGAASVLGLLLRRKD
jgi:hypothetical protein